VFERSPAEFVKDMHDMKIHVALHIVPQAASDSRVLYRSLHGSIPAASGEDVDATHIAPYWNRHKELFDAGVDGWWPDEGDWLDVPSRLERHRMYYEGPLSDRPSVRPWDLQRNGYIGISRWGGWVWSGDVTSTWKTLAEHVKIGQNSCLSVSPYWGSDIGGFYPTASKEYTGELYTRWFQFATFCPSFRSHGRTWHLHTPWGWNTGETGPIESRPPPDETELHNADVEPICREYLNLRYQLMPYTYTITREAHDTGLPMMRAMWLQYPNDPEAVKRGDQYLWGRDLLVAPVVERGAKNRDVYLPAGDWYDWWTGEKTTGGKVVTKDVDLKTMPLYVRAGAIIPVDPVRQYIDEPVKEPTTIRIYSGADGNFVLYDDDGNSLDYLKNGGTWTMFKWNDAAKKLEISQDKRTQDKLVEREFNVLLLPAGEHKTVKFSGAPVEVKFGS
jgi:alpha-glucosidase/alpha-D-xyloside xylohydrolase